MTLDRVCQLRHPIESCCVSQLRLMRMNADGRVNELIPLREQNPTIEIHGPVAVPDRDNRLNPSFASVSDDRLAIGVVAMSLEMSVRIDEHGKTSRRSLVVSRWQEQSPDICRQQIGTATARKIAWGRPPPAVQAERQLGRNSVVFNLHKSLRSEIQKVANRKVAQGQPPVSLTTDD